MIKRLDWDSEFFKFEIGSCQGKLLKENREEFIKEFTDNKFDCVYVFCDENDPFCAELESNKSVLPVGGHAEYELVKENWKRKNNGQARDIRVFNKKMAVNDRNIADQIKTISRNLVPISRFYYDLHFKLRAEDMYEVWADKIMSNEGGEIAIEMRDGKVAGMVGYIMGKDFGQISLVKTQKEFEGQGIASRLLDCALENLFKSGIPKIKVITQANNDLAKRLYQNAGFQIKKITKIYHWWKNNE